MEFLRPWIRQHGTPRQSQDELPDGTHETAPETCLLENVHHRLIRKDDLLKISMGIPYTDTGTFKQSSYSDKVILVDLTISLSTMGSISSHENMTNQFVGWQKLQGQVLADISMDMEEIQETGFIHDDIHEHTTLAALTIVLIVLLILIISSVWIAKKLTFLKNKLEANLEMSLCQLNQSCRAGMKLIACY